MAIRFVLGQPLKSVVVSISKGRQLLMSKLLLDVQYLYPVYHVAVSNEIFSLQFEKKPYSLSSSFFSPSSSGMSSSKSRSNSSRFFSKQGDSASHGFAPVKISSS